MKIKEGDIVWTFWSNRFSMKQYYRGFMEGTRGRVTNGGDKSRNYTVVKASAILSPVFEVLFED